MEEVDGSVEVLGRDGVELGEVEVGEYVVEDAVAHLVGPVDEDACAGGVEDEGAVVEFCVAGLEAGEDGVGHVDIVCVGLEERRVSVSVRVHVR